MTAVKNITAEVEELFEHATPNTWTIQSKVILEIKCDS